MVSGNTLLQEEGTREVDRPRVLLVDDEYLLLLSWAREFRRAGIEARTARTGREAARILVDSDGDFDAVLCDLHMNDGSGIELCRFIKDELPGLEHRIVIVTGGPTAWREIEFVRNTTMPVMHKPIDFETLIRLVRDWAARRRSPAAPEMTP